MGGLNMIRGLYSAASGLISQQRRHDTITNNIANIETVGYKQKTTALSSFNEMLLQYTEPNTNTIKQIGTWTGNVFAEEANTFFGQGDLVQTNRKGDFALVSDIQVAGMQFNASGKNVAENGEVTYQPQAYFTVRGEDNEVLYTRSGEFTTNAQGQLLTNAGEQVLGANGEPIVLPAGVSLDQLTLGGNGNLFTAAGEDTGIGFLISRVENPNKLIRVGDGSYRLEEGETVEPIAAGENVAIMQNYIERSNVDYAQAQVELMAAARAYEANAQIIKYYDQSLSKAVNEIGKVQ
jgi:flagellar basal-body rod protein FlgF